MYHETFIHQSYTTKLAQKGKKNFLHDLEQVRVIIFSLQMSTGRSLSSLENQPITSHNSLSKIDQPIT